MPLNDSDVIISGWNGKMGHAIRALTPFYFSGMLWNPTTLHIDALKHPVWIDFSNAQLFDNILQKVQEIHCPLIMGTTGLSAEQHEKLKQVSQCLPIFYDTNFSLGIHLLRKLLKHLPQENSFDVSIIESHHITKKDSPSGTAKSLQNILKQQLKTDVIPILSHRGGGIRGEHHIIFSGQNEILTLKHEVLDRSVFAEGALKAAVWCTSKSNGLFNMEDLLV